MAGGLTLIPSYTQDNDFPAYQDRLLMESMGVQAGVVGENDFKVTAGSGLQVEVEKGKGFVEQTEATQESKNSFYNGLYNILSPVKQNPYNSVEVPTTNPQIAQIILRIYDKEELGLTGNSFARIEWLNGAANAGATKAHAEEGKASEFGAAALPVSSFRCAYVIVPKNATVSSEYTIIDTRRFATKPIFNVLVSTSSVTAKSNEYIVNFSTPATITLPPVGISNQIIGVYNLETGGNTTINATGGANIYGDFIPGASSIKLSINQHVILLSDGAQWLIIAGEPKREQVYSALTTRAENTPFEVSSSRPAIVSLTISLEATGGGASIYVGGVKIASPQIGQTTGILKNQIPFSFEVPPGIKWEWKGNLGTPTAESSYLIK